MSNIKIDRIKSKKKIIIGSLIFISIVITLILITSKAKYKNVESIDLASGTINYIPADIDIVAIYKQNASGEYENVSDFSTSGYGLSSASYCNANGEKDPNVTLTYQNGIISASNVTKKVKCYLYFDNGVNIISNIKSQSKGEKTSFTGIATASDTGIYSAPDDYGTSYYFRGIEGSLNNWVKFADSYWRIIRVNGNDSIRMIYQGVANGNVSSSNKTGATTTIGIYPYNIKWNDNTFVGYMSSLSYTYNSRVTTSYEEAHANKYDSTAKYYIDYWYQYNISSKKLSSYIDYNTGFCNEREISNINLSYITGKGYGAEKTLYRAVDNVLTVTSYLTNKTTQTPTFKCTNKSRDLFTTNTSDTGNIGNKKLRYPIGMITMDEIIYAGGFEGATNKEYYLYTNYTYWTMTPYGLEGTSSIASVFSVNSSLNDIRNGRGIDNNVGLRPVINLKSDTKFIGSGTESDPYIVV